MKVISEIPSSRQLLRICINQRNKRTINLPLEGIPDTELLFYSDDPREFDAKVLKVFDNFVV